MKFDTNLIYHVYNQGNNKVPIFYHDENYLFFTRKLRKHIAPFADIICYCLMPNHFHLLLKPKDSAVLLIPSLGNSIPKNNLTHQIGTLLSSYTRAINNQEGRTGSLFRSATKIKSGWIGEVLIAGKNDFGIGDGYEVTCLNYIHNNPVKAKMVKEATDWKYSSAKEYAGLRNGTLCNLEIGRHFLSQW